MADTRGAYDMRSMVTLACFRIDESSYALDVDSLREIVRLPDLAPLPLAPEYVDGVIDLRGSLIPVLDLARLLGRQETTECSGDRVAVIDHSGLVFGLRFDAATQVVSLDESLLERTPDIAIDSDGGVVQSMLRRESEQPVMVLSLDRLIELMGGSEIAEDAAGGLA